MSCVVEDFLAMAVATDFVNDRSTATALVTPNASQLGMSQDESLYLRVLCLSIHAREDLLLANLDTASATSATCVNVPIGRRASSTTMVAQYLFLYHELRHPLSITEYSSGR
jgi:hypothetical protein